MPEDSEFTLNPRCPKCGYLQYHRYTCQPPPHDTTIRLECGRCCARWSMLTADHKQASADESTP